MTPLDSRDELDLDLAAPAPTPSRLGRWRAPVAVVITAVLVGASLGAVTRTLTAADPPPELPQAELAFAEAHLDDDNVAGLRLTLHNTGPAPVTMTSLETDGVGDGRVSADLGRTVPAGETAAVLVPVVPDCSRSLVSTSLKAQVRLADGRTVTAVPDRRIAPAGGLCRMLRTELPDGWWDQWAGVTVRPVDVNLELTLPPLEAGVRLAGVWVGETLLSFEQAPVLVGDRYLPITIRPLARCAAERNRLPTGFRILLAGAKGGLRTRYVVVGPDLARWLMRRCSPVVVTVTP